MKLVLIVPKAHLVSNTSSYASYWDNLLEVQARKRLWVCPTTSLLTIAALAEKDFEHVEYIDENYQEIDFNDNIDLVCISAVTHQAYRAYEIAVKFRQKNVKVIIGGIHPTLMPQEAAEYVDSVFIGEAEPLWDEFIDDFKANQLKKNYDNKKPGNYDLSLSPIPKYELIDVNYYKMIPISVSKGCPHKCEFCASSTLYGYKYRHKTVDQVSKELEIVTKIKKKSTVIYFPDDNLIAKKKFSKQLFKAFTGFDIRWYGHSDISVGRDKEMLKLLYASGCRQLLIGFESLTKEGLKNLDKNNFKFRHLEKYKEYVERIQQEGIGIIGSFMIGLDGDNIDEFKRIRDFVVENKLYATNITIQTPFPNTKLYQRLKQENRLFNENWNNYTGFEITYHPLNMTVKELERNYIWLYKAINSPEVIMDRLNHFKNINRKILQLKNQ